MSSRFQKVIATAVLGGALALTGCGEEGVEDRASSLRGDAAAPILLDARSVSATQLELTFNEAVQLGAVAAGDFSLKRNSRQPWVGFGSKSYAPGSAFTRLDGYSGVVGAGTSFSSWNPSVRWVVTSVSAVSFFGWPGASPTIPIASVQLNSADSTQVLLNLGTGIVEADDDGTGMLRLTYTDPGGGIADSAGNALSDIALTSLDQGNVREETGAPGVHAARTINSTQIELSFSEPVVTSNAALIAGSFRIGNSYVAIGPIMSAPSGSIWSSAMILSTQFQTATNLSLTSQGMKGILTVPATIPASWDEGTGRLGLTYTGAGPAEQIEDAIGNPLPDFWPALGEVGMIVDTL